MDRRKSYKLTASDRRALEHAREQTKLLMSLTGHLKADLIRKGLAEQTLRWFLDLNGNPTLVMLNRIANAMGYRLELRFTRQHDDKARERIQALSDMGLSSQA